MAANRVLNVFMNDRLVGTLTQAAQGHLQFDYSPDYISATGATPISVTMPLRSDTYDDPIARPFFSGLLPDNAMRTQLARYLGVSAKNPFSLLAEVGGECAGALSLYRQNETPDYHHQSKLIELSEEKLIDIFGTLSKRPLLVGEDGMRLSLAGVQNKLAVRMLDDKLFLVKGTAPTSHIIKPQIEGVEESAQNEFFCMTLAATMKIATPAVFLRQVADEHYFIIKRYDRVTTAPKEYRRLHQEDFCQALAVIPEKKYENEGGPGFQQCFNLLREVSTQPAKDLIRLTQLVIFNYLIGNADAHAKNFSLLYSDDGLLLSPCYDLLSTAVYADLSSKMAMKIDSKYKFKDVYLKHWESFAEKIGIKFSIIQKIHQQYAEELLPHAIELLNELNGQETTASPIYQRIIDTIKQHSHYLTR